MLHLSRRNPNENGLIRENLLINGTFELTSPLYLNRLYCIMDYTFTIDAYGIANAHFIMPHEAFGRFFTEDINNLSIIDTLLAKIKELEQNSLNNWHYSGHKLNLSLDRFEVEISDLDAYNQQEDSDIDDGFDYGFSHYNEESQSGCGLQDFQQALLSWRDIIIQTPKAKS